MLLPRLLSFFLAPFYFFVLAPSPSTDVHPFFPSTRFAFVWLIEYDRVRFQAAVPLPFSTFSSHFCSRNGTNNAVNVLLASASISSLPVFVSRVFSSSSSERIVERSTSLQNQDDSFRSSILIFQNSPFIRAGTIKPRKRFPNFYFEKLHVSIVFGNARITRTGKMGMIYRCKFSLYSWIYQATSDVNVSSGVYAVTPTRRRCFGVN